MRGVTIIAGAAFAVLATLGRASAIRSVAIAGVASLTIIFSLLISPARAVSFTAPQTFTVSNSYSNPSCSTDCSPIPLTPTSDFNFTPQPFDSSLGTLVATFFTISISGSSSSYDYCLDGCGIANNPTMGVQNHGIEILPLAMDYASATTYSATGSPYVAPGLLVQTTWTTAANFPGFPFLTTENSLGADPGPFITLESGFFVGNAAAPGSSGGHMTLTNISDSSVESLNLYYEYISPTPIPATLPLFATGLGALGLLGWRRKPKARAGLTE